MVKVSVVIPTYNRLNSLTRLLSGLEYQTYPAKDMDVIVVSDGSNDGTDNYIRNLTCSFPFKPIFQSNQGPAAARNNGIHEATGDIVVFIDDDVKPGPSLIEEHMLMHEEHGANAIVIGPMLTPADFKMKPWVLWEQKVLYKQYRDMNSGKWQPTSRQFYTGNSSLARTHLIESGGFDISFTRAEDVELAYRLADRGLHFYYNPKAFGFHYAERSFQSWFNTSYQYGRNDVVFTYQKGQDWLLKTVFDEFQTRNFFTRWLTKLCLNRPVISKVVFAGLKGIVDLGSLFDTTKMAFLACSGIFNVRYYQGVFDELQNQQIIINQNQVLSYSNQR